MASIAAHCSPGTQGVQSLVTVVEVLQVALIVAALEMFVPLMPTWERLNLARSRWRALAVACICMAAPPAMILTAGGAKTSLIVLAVNITIEASLSLLGMALPGNFYGLFLGLTITAANLFTQNLQLRTGWALHLYNPIEGVQVLGFVAVSVAAVILTCLAVGLWSASAGRGIWRLSI